MSEKTKHQRRRYAAAYKFAKLAALNGMIEQGGEYAKDGHKEKRRMSESWMKRGGANTLGFYNKAAARAAKRAVA